MPFFVGAQTVVIPRAGFPYCETFTNSTTRSNTIFRGDPQPPILTAGIENVEGDGYLRLTDNGINQRGYIFVDLPFSSSYGIKASFEYFAYGGLTTTGADGLSFFMFDGNIGASDFQIGGLGGSLGYAPWRSSNGLLTQVGLKGAYIGIGFDAFRNFGNEYEGRTGGFKDPDAVGFGPVPDSRQYYNTIAIRGPQTSNYKFIDGKRTYDLHYNFETQPKVYDDPISSIYYLWSGVPPSEYFSKRFAIGSPTKAELCSENGYRKVFINLAPVGGGNYSISVDMLINTGSGSRLVNIFKDVQYNYPAFKNLKIGFAASTGSTNTNFHEIRNVAVEVSSIDEGLAPKPPVLKKEVCVDDETEFEFDVDLLAQNAFISCIQLSEVDLGPADNSGSASNQFNCGLSGSCAQKCIDSKKTLTINGKGTLVSELVELTQGTGGNFDSERKKARLKFIPEPGFIGTFEAYYQITDNYGLLSDWTQIKVIVNPKPELVDFGEIKDPTCNGQNDGAISKIKVKNLVQGFSYTWKDQNGKVIPASKQTFSSTNSGGYIEVLFGLINLNLGTYTLEIKNPSLEAECNVIISKTLVQESGTPVVIVDPVTQLCEKTPVTYTPKVSSVYTDNVSSPPVFIWYTDPNKANRINSNSTQIKVNGNTVNTGQITIGGPGDGRLSIASLPAGNYTFYVEVDDTNWPVGGNFCLQRGVLEKVNLTVISELVANATTSPDWCRTSAGSIQVNAQGGTGAKTYTLFLKGNSTPKATQTTNNNSHTFSGLLPGEYEVEIFTQNPTCSKLLTPIKVDGPAASLAITAGTGENTFCNEPNGSLKFSIIGGNLPYDTVTMNGNPLPSGTSISGNTYTIPNLAAGNYKVEVTDTKNCKFSLDLTVSADPPSHFETTNDELCEGEIATVSVMANKSTSTPVYKWYYKDGAGAYIQITNGLNLSGVTFSINAANELSVTNLAPKSTPYTYYLNVTGTKVCDQGYIPAEILVNPKPAIATPEITQVTCNGAANGIIQAKLTTGNLADFEFSLVGNNGVNKPFAKNSGSFNALPAGTYELKVRSAKGCVATLGGLVVSEPAVLTINQVSKTDATCNLSNGEIRFNLAGGTPDGSGKYKIKVNGTDISTLGPNLVQNGPADFTIKNLDPLTYTIDVEDINACKKNLSVLILNTAVPVFDAVDVEICEGSDAVLTPKVVSNTIGAVPVFSWSYENPSNPGQYVAITNGAVVNGLTYSISNGVLTIKGLKYAETNYKYYLTVSGNKVCPVAPLVAEVKVFKVPTAVFQLTHVSCFGGSIGQINLTSGDPSGSNTYTLIEKGESNATGNFSDLKAGIYTIRIKETGSPCHNDIKLEITQPDLLELINPLKSDPTCGNINGSISFELKGGTKAYQIQINEKPLSDYSFSGTADKYEVKNLAPGTYGVQITDSKGCVLTKPNLFTLKNDDGYTVKLNPVTETKCLGSTATLNPVFTGTLPVTPIVKWYKDAALLQPIISSPTPDPSNITYQFNSSGKLMIDGLGEGDFEFYFEISGPGICTRVEKATVKIFPEIKAAITVENVSCFGSADGSISIVPSGGNGNYGIRFNGGAFSSKVDFQNLKAGIYTVDIRNDLGCLTSYQIEVKGPAAPITINKPSIIRSSCDLNNGSIEDLVISGGWGSYVVEWRFGSSTGNPIPGDLTGAKNLAPGKYYLLVSDLEGCKVTFDFTIEESSDPVYAIVPPIKSCIGAPVSIRPIHLAPNPSLPPAAATEVRWYLGPNQTGLIQDGPDPTLSEVVYTIDDTDWVNPQLKILGLPVGVYDYYFYVVCTGQEIKVELEVFDIPAVTLATKAVTCFEDSNGKVRITSGEKPFFRYKVNGGPTLDQAALEALNLKAGTYSLEVLTPAGCPQNLNITVEGPSAPLAISTLTKIDPGCGASNGKLVFSVSGGYAPYGIEVIKDGAVFGTQTSSTTSFQLDGYRPGVYQINIKDKEGCVVSSNSVTMVDGPTQILIPDVKICEGEVAKLTPSLNPPAPGAVFQWYLDPGKTKPISSSPSPAADGRIYEVNSATGEMSIANLPESSIPYEFYVTVSGPGTCVGYLGVGKVTVYGVPTATLKIDNEVCFGTGGTITVNASGGSGIYSYSLNGGSFVNTNVFSVPTGTHSISVKTSEGCSISLTGIKVTGPSGALNATGFNQVRPTCGINNGSIQFSISGGYPPYTVNYSKNGVQVGSKTIASPGGITLGALDKGMYSFTILDDKGCLFEVPSKIDLVEVPTDIAIQDDTICYGETAILTPSLPSNITNLNYIWSFDPSGNQKISSGTFGGITYSVDPKGTLSIVGLPSSGSPHTFYIMATGVGICDISPKPVQVIVNQIPTLKVSNPSVVCDPSGTVDLTDYIEGFNPAVYDYLVLSPSGNAMQIGDLDEVDVSGDYIVSSSLKGKGCWNDPKRVRVIIAEEELVANFQYEVDFGFNTILTNDVIQFLEDVKFTDLSKGKAIKWDWDFGDGATSSGQNPIHQYKTKGKFTIRLEATDNLGCISVFERVVTVLDEYKVIIPNAFTPDGPKNQRFRPLYRGIASEDFYIFSVWGELIYHSTSVEDNGWDGTLNGKPAPNGNYVYRGKFVSRSGELVEKSGVFILIR